MTRKSGMSAAWLAAGGTSMLLCAGVQAAPATRADAAAADHARIVAYWTPERRAAAIPRDFVKDAHGQGYLRMPDGKLMPYGRLVADGGTAGPMAGKPGGGDTTGPSVGGQDPAAGTTIPAAYTFKATVTDTSGIRSVSFKIQKQGSTVQSFSASSAGGGVYSVSLQGFTDGSWSWWVVARDGANNSTTTAPITFSVNTSGGGGGGGGGGNVVASASWGETAGWQQQALGRIYFEMPTNAKRTRWAAYVCSGTVVNDGNVTGVDNSIVLTAAHCAYDDANKAFARNVLFIPDQDGTTGAGTDTNCSNDPIGCWSPTYAVVDVDYTTLVFPDNHAWDYAFYVVPNTARHSGASASSQALESAILSPGTVGFGGSTSGTYTYALGYSYANDPLLMYCAEGLGASSPDPANWWLPSCGLTGGSSGGSWSTGLVVNGTIGSASSSATGGTILSVNSWGYTNSPGMAGPKLGNEASCVFNDAKSAGTAPGSGDGNAGAKVSCP